MVQFQSKLLQNQIMKGKVPELSFLNAGVDFLISFDSERS